MRTLIFLIAATVLGLPAQAADLNRPVEKFIDGFARPQTAGFAQTAQKLPSAVSAVCSGGSASAKAAFKATFAETTKAYSRIHFLRFGPLLAEDRASRLAFLPDPRAIAQRQIRKIFAAGDDTARSAATLAGKSVAVQGLTALELIAFDKTGSVRLGAADDMRDFTCDYALAIARNVAGMADAVATDWQDPAGYSAHLLTAGAGNPTFRTSKEALESIFNALVTGIVIARDQNVLPALGSSPAKAKPRRFPFSRSGNAVSFLSGELSGIRDALFSMELQRALPSDYLWLLDSLDFEFNIAQSYLAQLQPPLRATFKRQKDYDLVEALAIALKSVRDLMVLETAGALELSGGFNALDGD